MNVCAPERRDFLSLDEPVGGMQRLAACFHGHAYDPHRHETYAIGRTLRGAQAFRYRGTEKVSCLGECMVIHPDELHDGHAPDPSGFLYQMIYVEPWLLQEALGGSTLPFVSKAVAADAELFSLLSEIFHGFPSPLDPLEADGFVARLAELMLLRTDRWSLRRERTKCRTGVALARDFMDEEFHKVIDSAVLEKLTGLDRFELARAFRDLTGTSPHRFLVGRRLSAARRSILAGEDLADAAHQTGFADQSHMTRHFKARYGITPGRMIALARQAPGRGEPFSGPLTRQESEAAAAVANKAAPAFDFASDALSRNAGRPIASEHAGSGASGRGLSKSD